MCLGITPAAILGGVLSAGGSMLANSQAQRQAGDIAKARNDVLRETMRKNDALADESLARFRDRSSGFEDQNFQKAETDALAKRSAPLEAAVENEIPAASSLSGSAPDVVRSELAKVMSDVMAKGKSQAKSLAKIGSYGDTWFGQGIENNSANRDIGVTNNFAQGNLGVMPYLQDFAEIEATRPVSPLAGILQGAGNLLGSASGSGQFSGGQFGSLFKKPAAPKVVGLPTWGGPR